MFALVPFMEFLVPFIVKIFPNILPSTFQDEKNIVRAELPVPRCDLSF